jgi:hypothetical protein
VIDKFGAAKARLSRNRSSKMVLLTQQTNKNSPADTAAAIHVNRFIMLSRLSVFVLISMI